MSTTPTTLAASEETLLQRSKSFLGGAFFLLMQQSPRLLQLHRNEKSWTLFRVALGVCGAAVVVLPLSLWNGWITASFGLLMFLVSILLPPAETESPTDRKAAELGAQTVVSGGEYHSGDAPPIPVQLFVSPEKIWALDKNFESWLVIPTPEISSLRVQPSAERWLLRVVWAESKAEFWFGGFFAERLALLAEDSIRATAAPATAPGAKGRAAGV
jgi:hypothetical protein